MHFFPLITLITTIITLNYPFNYPSWLPQFFFQIINLRGCDGYKGPLFLVRYIQDDCPCGTFLPSIVGLKGTGFPLRHSLILSFTMLFHRSLLLFTYSLLLQNNSDNLKPLDNKQVKLPRVEVNKLTRLLRVTSNPSNGNHQR